MSARVLIADDSGTMRKIIIRSLKSVGITDVVEAADGEEACALFEQRQVDAVLADWNMPGKTGLEVLQAIRASGSSVPVMLITTEDEKALVLQAMEAGASDYLVKPFEAEQLRKKLEKHLPL